MRASHLQVGSLPNPELHPKILPHLGPQFLSAKPPPRISFRSRTQTSGLFHFNPLSPRTQDLGFQAPFILRDSSPPSRAQETNSSPSPRAQESQALCPGPKNHAMQPRSLLLNIPGPHPRLLVSSGPSARLAHPCWPPPRPPRRALCSPGRIHPPSPPVLAGRTWTKCGLEAWPTRLEGSGGPLVGAPEVSKECTGQGAGPGSWCPTGSSHRPRLPIARPHPRPERPDRGSKRRQRH